MYATPLATSVRPHFSQILFSSSAIFSLLCTKRSQNHPISTDLFGRCGGLVFLRDKYLEASVTLRRGIHRLVSEDDRRARRYNLRSLGKEFSRQPTFLRGQKKTLARAFLSLSRHLNPAKMSVCIRTL